MFFCSRRPWRCKMADWFYLQLGSSFIDKLIANVNNFGGVGVHIQNDFRRLPLRITEFNLIHGSGKGLLLKKKVSVWIWDKVNFTQFVVFFSIVLDSERWIEACFSQPVYVTSVALQYAPDVTLRNKITYELTYGFTGFRKNYTDSGKSVVSNVLIKSPFFYLLHCSA